MARYRIGRKLGRTIYDGDRLIGMMDSAADAAWIVDLMNRATKAGERPTTEDHEAWLKRDQALHPATDGDADAVAGA
jgi:hypothetical protein